MDKQIANMQKQNDGMETAFKNKGIQYTKLSIDEGMDLEMRFNMLKEYNNYLKDISAANRPPPQPSKLPAKAETKKSEEDDDDEAFKDVKPVYSTITNMEDIKRAFFNKEYDNFNTLVKQHSFKFYKANYRYSSDYNDRPNYVAKNLLRGFIQNLDDYRKYLMVCFRCIHINSSEYRYPSYWIVNSNDDIKTILGSLYEDYEFIDVTDNGAIDTLLKKMEKNENENDDALIGEVYLH